MPLCKHIPKSSYIIALSSHLLNSFFQISGTKKPFVNNIILQTCGFVASLAALPAARTLNRRSMLLTGYSVTSITMFIVALLYTLVPHDPKAAKAMVAMVCLFNVAYGYRRVLTSQLCTTNKRCLQRDHWTLMSVRG